MAEDIRDRNLQGSCRGLQESSTRSHIHLFIRPVTIKSHVLGSCCETVPDGDKDGLFIGGCLAYYSPDFASQHSMVSSPFEEGLDDEEDETPAMEGVA